MQVVNKRFHTPTDKDIYIGRPSPLGNPYTHMKNTSAKFVVSTRDEAINKYRTWLYKKLKEGDAEIIAELEKIKSDSILVCWCAQERKSISCHGQVIISLLEKFTIEEIRSWSKK